LRSVNELCGNRMVRSSKNLRAADILGEYMSLIRSVAFLIAVTSSVFLSSQDALKVAGRDPMLLNILTRIVTAAGGAQRLAAVQGLSESGEIEFYWGENIKGPVTIRSLGGTHFRMEADLPQGKKIWVANDGSGSRKEADQKAVALPYAKAINLGNLTFPVAYVVAALSDPAAEVSLVRIENDKDRSIYHLRLKGRLGLIDRGPARGAIVKDLLVDAASFDILTVEDFPYSRGSTGKGRDAAPREIDYQDFRLVSGVRVPFSINTKLEGQRTFSIHLREAAFDANLTVGDFAN
jgi:hypothetical protein